MNELEEHIDYLEAEGCAADDEIIRLNAEVKELSERLERAEGDKAILNGALSTVCDERDAAYSEIDDLTKQNKELFEDIEKITSANADLAGWSRAKDERISELEKRLAEYEDTPRGTS